MNTVIYRVLDSCLEALLAVGVLGSLAIALTSTCLFAVRRCRVIETLSHIHLYAPLNFCAAPSLPTNILR